MKTAIATVCLSGGLDEKRLAIANAGFKRVEVFENDLLSCNGTPADVRRTAHDLGLEIVTFRPFRDFEAMPADRSERNFARAERKFVDLGGLVRGQVVRSSDGALQIILNASQSSRTQSSRFLSELFGSGVQHIAFATGDIFAAVAALRANDVPLLDIPENDYDDLEARAGLAGDELDRLKSLNILYDRDGATEYFQVYAHAFEERFFFEIVQRRNFTSFGAANAPIRLAARSRLVQPR